MADDTQAADDTQIVAATGIASASQAGNDDLAEQIETAMRQAVLQCLDQGITDPDQQRERILAARAAVLGE